MNPSNREPKGLLIIAHPSGAAPDDATLPSPEEPDADDDNVNNNAGQSCATCYSYQPETGRCLMYPPNGSEWSMVEADEWCCQYKAGKQHPLGGGQSQETAEPAVAGTRPAPNGSPIGQRSADNYLGR